MKDSEKIARKYTNHDCEYNYDPMRGKCDICYEIGDAVNQAVLAERENLKKELCEKCLTRLTTKPQ